MTLKTSPQRRGGMQGIEDFRAVFAPPVAAATPTSTGSSPANSVPPRFNGFFRMNRAKPSSPRGMRERTGRAGGGRRRARPSP